MEAAAATSTTVRRDEASGNGWRERFVDADRAAITPSVAAAVAQSLSYVIFPDFASEKERCDLRENAFVLQNLFLKDGNSCPEFQGRAVKWVAECSRFSVEKLLDDKTKCLSELMLKRLLRILEFGLSTDDGCFNSDNDLSNLALSVFGTDTGLQDMSPKWYDESYETLSNPEPMVNVYEKGGFFKKHGDGMSLTLLIVLKDAEEGGGTAFYLDEDEVYNADEKPDLIPERIERPPEGTAMIWGPTLQHSAMPVLKGRRSVFVGSFSLDEATSLAA